MKELFKCTGRVVERFSPGKALEGGMVDAVEGVEEVPLDDAEGEVLNESWVLFLRLAFLGWCTWVILLRGSDSSVERQPS